MDPISLDMITQGHENGLISTAWQPTLTAASQGQISILRTPRSCNIHTPICGSFIPRVNWYLDPISFDVIAQEHENGLSSTVRQPTLTAASQGRISILWKPRTSTIYTPICGSLGPRVNWHMDPTSFDVIAQEHVNGLRSTVWQSA